jgi:uncharacterized delta-60 repeat protein
LYRFNADGSYDTTFGTDGHVQVSYNNGPISLGSINIQPDKKIVLKDYLENTIIIRLNLDGTLDSTFDDDGILILSFGSIFGENINDITIQPDGKLIVLVHTFYFSNTNRTLTARLNADGSFDTSYGTNGVSAPLAVINGDALNLQTDGKIVVSGNLSIVRYNANGSLDTTFDSDGTATVTNTDFYGSIKKTKTLADGKIVASVTGTISSNNESMPVFKIYQLNPNGTLVTSFGSNGQYYEATTFHESNNLFIASNGTILSSGTSYNNDSFPHLGKIEITSNGILQNTSFFNLKLFVDEINGTIEQASGKIVSFCNQNQLVRHNIDGTIDTTFGTNGSISLAGTYSNKIVQQADGKFLLYNTSGSTIYRRDTEGILDSTFGTNGVLNLPNIGIINAIYPTSDNKLFLLGTNFGYSITKLNNNGTVDTSFAADTEVLGRFDFFEESEGETSENMIVQSNNKIVVAVSLVNAANDTLATGLIRFNPDGTLDTTFGTGGKTVIQESNYITPKKMCLLENDAFVISSDIGNGATKLIKYNSNGFIDSNFNNTNLLNDIYSTNEVIVQPDFKILKSTHSNNQFTMARYDNVTGALDTTFGTNGFINTPIGLCSNINQLTWLHNNTLLASGTSFDGTNEVVALARYINLNLGTLNFTNENVHFLVYPNPIQEEATFEYTLQNDEIVSIEIIDMHGRIVQTIIKNQRQSVGNYKQKINLSILTTSSNYILKFSSNKGSASIKIIKK